MNVDVFHDNNNYKKLDIVGKKREKREKTGKTEKVQK
jgi:hypothetical protein